MTDDKLQALLLALEDAINEPSRLWATEPMDVCDYRHHLYRIWGPLRDAIATPKALAASPEVQALMAEAVAAEQVRCADVDLIHEAICNAHDMDATFSDYARSVAAAIRRAEGETT